MNIMRKFLIAASLLGVLGASSVLPATADANGYWYHHHYYRCEAHRHRAGAVGAISGAIGGGLIGGALSHGNAGGALLGAGAGALIGHQVAKGSVHC
jgi:hypothetical protein